MNNYNNEGKTIDFKYFIISYLKKWRIILIAMIVGALLFGVIQILKAPNVITASKDVITANQKQIDKNNETIAEYKKTITSNKSKISSNNDNIVNRENDIVAAKQKLSEQQSYLASYENLLNESNKLKNIVAAKDRAVLIVQIAELTDKIMILETEIKATEASIKTYEQEIADMKLAVSSSLPNSIEKTEQKIVALEKKNDELRAAIEPYPEKKSLTSIIIFSIIGLFMGAFAVACFELIKITLCGKVNSSNCIKERYHIPVLSVLHIVEGKHKTKLDLTLERLNGEKREIDEAVEYEILAAKIQSICPEDKKNILLCGSIDTDSIEKLRIGITKFIGDKITIDIAQNPCQNADAALAVKNSCVVLVEKINESVYTVLDQIIEQLTLSNSRILGCILI